MKPTLALFLALTFSLPLAAAKKPQTGTTTTANTTWNGIARQYSIYAPAALGANPAMVVCLHATVDDGSGSNPPASWCPGKLTGAANRFGFLLVSPVSTWSNGRWFWDSFAMDSLFADPPDDAGFLRSVILAVSSEYNVSQVFVYGVSSGGFEAHALGIASGDLVSAIASASGMLWADADSVPPAQYPVSVLQCEGATDKLVPPCGGFTTAWGPKTATASTDATLDYWLQADGLALPATNVCTNGSLTPGFVSYAANGANGVQVEYVLELDEGHGCDPGFPEAAMVWLLGHGR